MGSDTNLNAAQYCQENCGKQIEQKEKANLRTMSSDTNLNAA